MMTPRARFWSHVDRSAGADACWPWTGETSHGYGSSTHGRAHRHAWKLECGALLQTDEVCHKCDNKLCCNPAHLFLGTHAANMQDMLQKDRHFNGRRKLGMPLVKLVKSELAAGVRQCTLADRLGLTRQTINNIARGRAYATVVV